MNSPVFTGDHRAFGEEVEAMARELRLSVSDILRIGAARVLLDYQRTGSISIGEGYTCARKPRVTELEPCRPHPLFGAVERKRGRRAVARRPEPTRFPLKVSPTGWINIIQGDEDNEPDPIRVILSPREAGELLKALPQFVEAAADCSGVRALTFDLHSATPSAKYRLARPHGPSALRRGRAFCMMRQP